MTTSELLWRIDWYAAAISNLIVLAISIESYRHRPRRSVMLIAIAAATAFFYILVSWIAEKQSRVFWDALSIVNIGGALLWVAGMHLLLRELRQRSAEPVAPSHGRAALLVDNSDTTRGPPPVA